MHFNQITWKTKENTKVCQNDTPNQKVDYLKEKDQFIK